MRVRASACEGVMMKGENTYTYVYIYTCIYTYVYIYMTQKCPLCRGDRGQRGHGVRPGNGNGLSLGVGVCVCVIINIY